MKELYNNVETNSKAILISIDYDKNDTYQELLELSSLCSSCDIDTVDMLTQKMDQENPKSYFGKGKLEELKMMINSFEEDGTIIDLIVCNDELSPSQIEFLEKELEKTIFDRTYVILEIFRTRAKTKEAKLQVEIASLNYMLPRLVGMRKGLSRQGGGKNKGKGETQLELDKRKIEAKLALLKNELKELTKERKFQRLSRKKNQMLIASLVGYTNSGKSTTMNSILKLTNSNKFVLSENKLFATLETSTRNIKLSNNIEFLLTDTVGFINKLPHSLVEAFKSTLEEIKESDLIIHVVDSSDPKYLEKIDITNNVLQEIGAIDIPTLYVFNKTDINNPYFYIPQSYKDYVRFSAATNQGMENLLKKIEEMLFSKNKNVTCKIPYSNSKLISLIQDTSKVINIKYLDDYTLIEASVSEYIYNLIKDYII